MRKGKRDKLEFQRGMLGRLSPAALHEQLHAVATDNPSGLSTLNKPEMQKLLKAYVPDRPGAKGGKEAVLTELVGAILSHHEFAVFDETIMVVPAATTAALSPPLAATPAAPTKTLAPTPTTVATVPAAVVTGANVVGTPQ